MLRRFFAFERYQRRTRPKNSTRRVKSLRGQMSGPALVIGNAPSSQELLDLDLEILQCQVTVLSQNFYFNTNLSKSLSPNYLFMCDELFWQEKYSDYRNFVKTKQSLSNFLLVQPDYLEALTFEESILRIRKNPLTSFTNRISVTSGYCGLPNYTIFYMISTALYLGYSPIFVIGSDFNHYAFVDVTDHSVKLRPHHSYPEDSYEWPNRTSLSRVLNANLQQINGLRLFNDKNVFTVGRKRPHDILPFISLTELVKKLGLGEF